MSLARNILASYVSQAYVVLITLVMFPVYLRYMGAEAFGLVGFFALLSAIFALLDAGFSPTLSREVARFRGGASDAVTLHSLVRALELIFSTIAVVAAFFFFFLSEYISNSWLSPEQLPVEEVRVAVVLMGIAVPLRWMSVLYRSAINGFERQVWLSAFSITIATARFAGVLGIFHLFGTTPVHFFAYQLAIAAIELGILAPSVHTMLPLIDGRLSAKSSWKALRHVLGFSLTVALTAGVWVVITQADKVVLSRLLPLSEFGYISLAVYVAGGVGLVNSPILQALLPRLARLQAEGLDEKVVDLYRKSTQLVCLVVTPSALVLAVCSRQVLWAWTGDVNLTVRAAPVLALYALGNGVLAITMLTYALQYAKGNFNLHLVGNALMSVLMVPTLILASSTWGAVGAGWTWLTAMLMYFLFWVPVVHRRFVPGLHYLWITRDVMPILGSACIIALAAAAWLPATETRIESGVVVVATGTILAITTLTVSRTGRSFLRKAVRRWLAF